VKHQQATGKAAHSAPFRRYILPGRIHCCNGSHGHWITPPIGALIEVLPRVFYPRRIATDH
jgi:hypothetical protein